MNINAEDVEKQRAVAERLEAFWNCEVLSHGALDDLDFTLSRDGKIVGHAELKCRGHNIETYDTVFLALHKWLCLVLASVADGNPSYIVYRFDNGDLYWLDVCDVPTGSGKLTMDGARRTRSGRPNIEPMFSIPVELLHKL